MATDSTISDPIIGEALPFRSDSDEFVNSITHGLGVLLSVVGAIVLYQATSQETIWTQLAAMAYAASLLAVYLLSTLSHAVQSTAAKHRFRAWDQGTIYFLIVGTYTPFVVAYLPATQAAIMVAVLWLAAGIGFWSKVIANHRVNSMSTWSYIALGWLPALAFIGRVPLECVTWMAIGGLSYTVGTVFLILDKRVSFFHAIWHLLVVAASVCHYYSILRFVVT